MALKALMKRRELDVKRSALSGLEAKDAEFVTRSSEIEASINEAATDEERAAVEEAVNNYETEHDAHEQEKERLRGEIEQLESELAEIEAAAPAPVKEEKIEIEREGKKPMEVRSTKAYEEAYLKYLKTGKDTECRSLLSQLGTGDDTVGVPVPTTVENEIKHAFEKVELANLVKKSYVKGIMSVGFEKSATGAEWHTEGGSAPTEESLELGIAKLIPQALKKWITISDESIDNNPAILNYIYEEMAYRIAKGLSDDIIQKLNDAAHNGDSKIPNVPSLIYNPDVDVIVKAIALLSDEVTDLTLVMNPSTWATLKGMQYNSNYAVDIFEGAKVVKTTALPSFEEAEQGETYIFVGDFNHGYMANFPAGEDITFKFDETSLAEKDLVKVVGRMYVGHGVVAPNAFVSIEKA